MTKVLGFNWNSKFMPIMVPIYPVHEVYTIFNKSIPHFIYNANKMEGYSYTESEVMTLLRGIAVGGHRISEQDQLLNLIAGVKYIVKRVEKKRFLINKPQLCNLHAVVAKNKHLEIGMFRGEGNEQEITPFVDMGNYGRYTPQQTTAGGYDLYKLFVDGADLINTQLGSHFEKAVVLFLFISLNKFFFTSNTRVAFFMMNGVLISNGMQPISVPVEKLDEFRAKMINFYFTRHALEIISFLIENHPDAHLFKY